MLVQEKVIEYSARILAVDSDGSVFLFLGDDDWTIGCLYQWGDKFNQVWFSSREKVLGAIEGARKSAGIKSKVELRPNTIQVLRRETTVQITIDNGGSDD